MMRLPNPRCVTCLYRDVEALLGVDMIDPLVVLYENIVPLVPLVPLEHI